MKKIALVIGLISWASTSIAADEREDFGFRTMAGAITGIGKPIAEVSFWADFYLFSRDFRMLFGFNLFDPPGETLPPMNLQAIGVEYNARIPKYENHKITFGVRYNKTYMQTERENYRPQRGMSYHLGYKFPLRQYDELVFEMGRQYRPVNVLQADPEFPINDTTYFYRAGWEIYF